MGGLWLEIPGPATDTPPRARALALLAILAASGPKGASRERVLGILWPDSDSERARHALSQTLYALRQALGVDVIISTPDLSLDPARIITDLAEFRSAVLAERWDEAAARFTGHFLDGFYLGDAPDFERWTESERANLAVDGARAIEHAARARTARGELDAAAECWRRLTRLDPLRSRIAASYMEALEALDDRAGALAHGNAFVELLRRELDTVPDRSVQQVLARLRGVTFAEPAATPRAANVHQAQADHVFVPPHRPRPRTRLVALAVLAAGIVVILGWRAFSARVRRAPAVLAVGHIRDLATAGDSMHSSGVLSDMLSTSLGRLNGLQLIANSRIIELTPPGSDTLPRGRSDAARRAGATEVIEGELTALPNDQLRLEVRRVDLSHGRVRSAYRITGTDRLALLDSATVLVAADLRLPAPTGSLAAVSTSSPIAYQLYEDGLRALFQFDAFAANRFFRAAIVEDPSFAMATYYAWRSAVAISGSGQDSLASRALALASRASERDRLLILTHIGYTRYDVRATAAADSLVARFGNDPDALIRAAEVTGDLARATLLLNRAIALDSAAGVLPHAVCRLCDAFYMLSEKYRWADSGAAVERTTRRWSTLRPGDFAPWAVLADHLSSVGRRADAKVAMARVQAIGGLGVEALESNLTESLRADDVPVAAEECRGRLAAVDTKEYERFRWLCIITLRIQGRFRDALLLARGGPGVPFDPTNVAILDGEMGRPLLAAEVFASFAGAYTDTLGSPVGVRARNLTWFLTLTATQAIAGGDTVRGRLLADSIEHVGRLSLFPRDPVLHHFVRGLLLARVGRHADAVREYTAAMVSPTNGYTRINYELGKSLTALGRPAEAIPVVRAALHGGLDGAGLYLNRTETHELLAQAFDASRQRDSAAAHYAVVERSWRTADPALRARYDAARNWLSKH